MHAELTALRGAGSEAFEGMIGTSQAMQKVFETLARVAPSDSTVLITGESGTGKELAARALHARSVPARATNPVRGFPQARKACAATSRC